VRCWRIRIVGRLLVVLGAAAVVLAPPAAAQVRLPSIGIPPAGVLREVTGPLTNPPPAITNDLAQLRRLQIQDLLRTQRRTVDVDRAGEPIVRGEILTFAPSLAALERAAADGLSVLRRERLSGLDADLVVLTVPPTASVHRVLKTLRRADPTGTYDYNHLYMSVGVADGPAAPVAPDRAGATPIGTARASRIGVIDSGVDPHHPALAGASVQSWGCQGVPHPDAHGTAVGSLIAGHDDRFRGAAPGATLYAADVYCGRPDGGATDAIAGAFAWLAGEHVPVISVSLVGPDNGALAAVVARMVERGFVIVAAVGNDGPAAPPLYPAAYPGVVGVTGVDAHRHVLLEANRGPQVEFAAPGADMVAAVAGGGYREVRGTSFAAPIVAGLLATHCAKPGRSCVDEAVAALAREAIDLGSRGRDPVYGYGLVGDDIRTAPEK
jgi:subtilisin family serine protease